MLTPGPYKRFIELLFERNAAEAFQGKYAAVLTTSIRFFDFTAANYVAGISEDLGMHYAGVFSAAMYDLLDAKEQEHLVAFADQFFSAIEQRLALPRRNPPLVPLAWKYEPSAAVANKVDLGGKKLVVLMDSDDAHPNTARMVEAFCRRFAKPPEVVDLRSANIRGGCTGCLQCSFDNTCIYRESDDVRSIYEKLAAADALVFAGAIHDRFLSSRWKLFCDRGFYHNHVPIYGGKQIAWLVSGPLQQLANLRQILEGYTELENANLVGIVTDECGSASELDRLLGGLAEQLARCTATGYRMTPSFLGVASQKLFRDEVWAHLRTVFQADHRYYKKHGLYDFPRRSIGRRVADLFLTLLLKLPSFRREFQRKIRPKMVESLKNVVDKDSSSS
jgi:NAD(P)H-dependent FMN reductase